MKHFGLLPRIIVAIVLGILLAHFMPMAGVRLFLTFMASSASCWDSSFLLSL